MDNRNMKVLGGVGTVIGAGITIFGKTKYDAAAGQYRASEEFGHVNSADIWSGHMSNYKICIIIGAIVLLIGIIILIAGFLAAGNSQVNENENVKENNKTASQRLKELQEMRNENLITQEEFDEKKKQILESM